MADVNKNENGTDWVAIINGMSDVETRIKVTGKDGKTATINYGINALLNLALTVELPDAEHLQPVVDANLEKLPLRNVAAAEVEYVGGLDQYVAHRRELVEANGSDFDRDLVAAAAGEWNRILAYRKEHGDDAYVSYDTDVMEKPANE